LQREQQPLQSNENELRGGRGSHGGKRYTAEDKVLLHCHSKNPLMVPSDPARFFADFSSSASLSLSLSLFDRSSEDNLRGEGYCRRIAAASAAAARTSQSRQNWKTFLFFLPLPVATLLQQQFAESLWYTNRKCSSLSLDKRHNSTLPADANRLSF
jgi:hypothetical protein